MLAKLSELRCKEVICVGDGRRLGYVCDVQIQVPEGCILSLIVPGPCKFLGVLGRREDYVIPWQCIRRIGPDIILVDVCLEDCCTPRHKLWGMG